LFVRAFEKSDTTVETAKWSPTLSIPTNEWPAYSEDVE
jgi:hypothetical protein